MIGLVIGAVILALIAWYALWLWHETTKHKAFSAGHAQGYRDAVDDGFDDMFAKMDELHRLKANSIDKTHLETAYNLLSQSEDDGWDNDVLEVLRDWLDKTALILLQWEEKDKAA